MPRHSDAEHLKLNDLFNMAGGHYVVLETYEVVDPEMITVAFAQWNGSRRYKMTVPRDLPFTLINR